MIANIRLLSHQLATPNLNNPKDLVSWMGAMQAQDYNMAKWAVGIRLQSGTLDIVDEALQRGDILRTHVMRPTWHFVAAEDIRWMLKLTNNRIKAANRSSILGISDSTYTEYNLHIEKILRGNKNLTRQEIAEELAKLGIVVDNLRMNRLMMGAEAEGLVCSGIDKNKKPTYALLEERVAPVKELHKEEALAKLAIRYFRSHSPASLNDFVWWSGLSITEARLAMNLIESELIADRFETDKLFVHQSYDGKFEADNMLHFLPGYDEYLISYKDRTAVLNADHYPKAFNNYGIFYPVIAYNGKVVGNWKKSIKKGQIVIETSFFEPCKVSPELIKTAEDRYRAFIG